MPITIASKLQAAGSFQVADAVDIKGGFMAVADITARDAIHSSKRLAGMIVGVVSTNKRYILGSDLLTWTVDGQTSATTPVAVSGTDIDWALSNIRTKSIAADTDFTFSNVTDGQVLVFKLSCTGDADITFPNTVDFGGLTPITSIANGDKIIFTFIAIGGVIECSYRL